MPFQGHGAHRGFWGKQLVADGLSLWRWHRAGAAWGSVWSPWVSEIHKVHSSNLTNLESPSLLLQDEAVLPLRFITIAGIRELGGSLTSNFLQIWDGDFVLFFWLRNSKLLTMFIITKKFSYENIQQSSVECLMCDWMPEMYRQNLVGTKDIKQSHKWLITMVTSVLKEHS